MPRFRSAAAVPGLTGVPLTLETVRRLLDDVLAPRHFFTGPSLRLEFTHVEGEESAWEIFQGRLLDPAHTRQRAVFEAWNVHQVVDGGLSAEPLLALKLDAANAELHVVRGLDCYVWEGYDAGGNVYLSRERRKWVRELACTVALDRLTDLEELRDELIAQLFHAVVGASRLPLASVEAPLPAFSFGELLYCYRDQAAPAAELLHSYRDLVTEMLAADLNRLERARLLETFLHAAPLAEAPQVEAAVALFVARWTDLGQTGADLVGLLRTLFNEVSLSPYTDLVDRTLLFLETLQRQAVLGPAEVLDFLGGLLRQVGRHLTAYDLVTFHHRGANYPDALLLDAVLKRYLTLCEAEPTLLEDAAGNGEELLREKRLRRRALRQGWLLRRCYEGLLVPDSPTSPGENNRVLPGNHPRVPEEQILQTTQRRRRLYDGDPLPTHLGPHTVELLRRSVRDLRYAEELRELGLALFLDRPFGDAKAPAEPDRTLLLASLAFSRSVAEKRLLALQQEPNLLADEAVFAACREQLRSPELGSGLSLDRIGPARRPGTVTLLDARRAAGDFVFLRTTPGSLAELLSGYDFSPLTGPFALDFLTVKRHALVARDETGSRLVVYDERLRPRLTAIVGTKSGYEVRAGREFPREGLAVVGVWEETPGGGLHAHDLSANPIQIGGWPEKTYPV
jgi:hypothetical protein